MITYAEMVRYVLDLEQENERLRAERDHWRRVCAAMKRAERRRARPDEPALQALADQGTPWPR